MSALRVGAFGSLDVSRPEARERRGCDNPVRDAPNAPRSAHPGSSDRRARLSDTARKVSGARAKVYDTAAKPSRAAAEVRVCAVHGLRWDVSSHPTRPRRSSARSSSPHGVRAEVTRRASLAHPSPKEGSPCGIVRSLRRVDDLLRHIVDLLRGVGRASRSRREGFALLSEGFESASRTSTLARGMCALRSGNLRPPPCRLPRGSRRLRRPSCRSCASPVRGG